MSMALVFLAVPCCCLRFEKMVFPDHITYFFRNENVLRLKGLFQKAMSDKLSLNAKFCKF